MILQNQNCFQLTNNDMNEPFLKRKWYKSPKFLTNDMNKLFLKIRWYIRAFSLNFLISKFWGQKLQLIPPEERTHKAITHPNWNPKEKRKEKKNPLFTPPVISSSSPMYANFLHNYPTVTLTLSSIHAFRPIIFTQNLRTEPLSLHLQPKKSRTIISCAANSDGVKGAVNWAEILEKWSPKNFLGADKLFRAISGATSSPIAQYIPSPFTFVHSVDPRIKLVQKLSFLRFSVWKALNLLNLIIGSFQFFWVVSEVYNMVQLLGFLV